MLHCLFRVSFDTSLSQLLRMDAETALVDMTRTIFLRIPTFSYDARHPYMKKLVVDNKKDARPSPERSIQPSTEEEAILVSDGVPTTSEASQEAPAEPAASPASPGKQRDRRRGLRESCGHRLGLCGLLHRAEGISARECGLRCPRAAGCHGAEDAERRDRHCAERVLLRLGGLFGAVLHPLRNPLRQGTAEVGIVQSASCSGSPCRWRIPWTRRTWNT